MGIDRVEFGEETERNDEIESVALEEMKRDFSNPIKIKNIEDIKLVFEQLKDSPEICISIPILAEGGITKEQLLPALSVLRREIFKYLDVGDNSSIEKGIKLALGEILQNPVKHSLPNAELNEIYLLVRKKGRHFSLFVANPAKPDVNLEIDPAVNIDQPDGRGRLIVKSLLGEIKESLKGTDCPPPEDKPFYIEDPDKRRVGVFEEFEATFPEDGQLNE